MRYLDIRDGRIPGAADLATVREAYCIVELELLK